MEKAMPSISSQRAGDELLRVYRLARGVPADRRNEMVERLLSAADTTSDPVTRSGLRELACDLITWGLNR